MTRLQSYEPERVELADENDAWLTPAFASQGYAEWYAALPPDDRPNPNPPLSAEATLPCWRPRLIHAPRSPISGAGCR